MQENGDERWMRLALEVCEQGIRASQSPFGAAIVRGEELLAVEHNAVLRDVDPTAHAELRAIRAAARLAGRVHLDGSTIYSTTEPCPMCFAAIHWARIPRIVFAAGIADAARAGFNEMAVGNAELKRVGGLRVEIRGGVLVEEALALYRLWSESGAGRTY